jgi:branched-chain amino acid transport system ATP-binding protein
MLVLDDIHCAYGKIEALKGISLEVKKGEIVTLIGANGAGKTTTLMTICGVNRIKQGKIEFNGERIDGLPAHEIVRRGICQAPEGRRIFARLTVLENLEMGAVTRSDNDAIRKDIDWVFSLFPILKDRHRQLGGTLSGGEQQMLAIARALMGRPRLLLLDEPSLGLAPIIVAKIFEVIKTLNQQGVTIFLVEQNARMALRLARRGYVIETGRVMMSDSAQALLDSPRVQEAYLGA